MVLASIMEVIIAEVEFAMLRRKIADELLKWKNREDKMCLVVKTYRAIFDGDLDVETLIKQISLRVRGAELVQGETLLFFDEIQNCPRARTALKFFAIDKRFDIIASGSLLGINYKDVPSYPVGYVEHLEMYSLDFEEFLWANGVTEKSVADIKEYFNKREKVPSAMHEKMMELFKEHIVVGGMPRVVAEGAEKTKARACFLSIPKHLSKYHRPMPAYAERENCCGIA